MGPVANMETTQATYLTAVLNLNAFRITMRKFEPATKGNALAPVMIFQNTTWLAVIDCAVSGLKGASLFSIVEAAK